MPVPWNVIIPAASVLAGVWLGAKLNFMSAHKTWVLDQKKLEWRELIDVVSESFVALQPAVQGTSLDDSSIPRVFAVLRNRMFIADTVKREHLEDRWDCINSSVSKIVMWNRQPPTNSVVRKPDYPENEQRLISREGRDLPELLIQLSRKDLRVK